MKKLVVSYGPSNRGEQMHHNNIEAKTAVYCTSNVASDSVVPAKYVLNGACVFLNAGRRMK